MRTRRTLILVAALAVLGTGCYPYLNPPGNAPLRYRDKVFPNITKTFDVTYGSATNAENQVITLKFDSFEPTGDTATQRPAIIWVHGGSFSSGDKNSPEIVDEMNNFAAQGYFNASITYRLEPGGCSAGSGGSNCDIALHESLEDAQTAVRFFKANAAQYRIDPNRIAIGGSSAGAIVAMNVGFATSENPASGVRAAVALSGADLISPENAGDAPSLLFHGTADPLVPYQWAVNTYNNAKAAGLDSYLITWDGAGHVPYAEHHDEIITRTTNFLYWEMDLAHAQQ